MKNNRAVKLLITSGCLFVVTLMIRMMGDDIDLYTAAFAWLCSLAGFVLLLTSGALFIIRYFRTKKRDKGLLLIGLGIIITAISTVAYLAYDLIFKDL